MGNTTSHITKNEKEQNELNILINEYLNRIEDLESKKKETERKINDITTKQKISKPKDRIKLQEEKNILITKLNEYINMILDINNKLDELEKKVNEINQEYSAKGEKTLYFSKLNIEKFIREQNTIISSLLENQNELKPLIKIYIIYANKIDNLEKNTETLDKINYIKENINNLFNKYIDFNNTLLLHYNILIDIERNQRMPERTLYYEKTIEMISYLNIQKLYSNTISLIQSIHFSTRELKNFTFPEIFNLLEDYKKKEEEIIKYLENKEFSENFNYIIEKNPFNILNNSLFFKPNLTDEELLKKYSKDIIKISTKKNKKMKEYTKDIKNLKIKNTQLILLEIESYEEYNNILKNYIKNIQNGQKVIETFQNISIIDINNIIYDIKDIEDKIKLNNDILNVSIDPNIQKNITDLETEKQNKINILFNNYENIPTLISNDNNELLQYIYKIDDYFTNYIKQLNNELKLLKENKQNIELILEELNAQTVFTENINIIYNNNIKELDNINTKIININNILKKYTKIKLTVDTKIINLKNELIKNNIPIENKKQKINLVDPVNTVLNSYIIKPLNEFSNFNVDWLNDFYSKFRDGIITATGGIDYATKESIAGLNVAIGGVNTATTEINKVIRFTIDLLGDNFLKKVFSIILSVFMAMFPGKDLYYIQTYANYALIALFYIIFAIPLTIFLLLFLLMYSIIL